MRKKKILNLLLVVTILLSLSTKMTYASSQESEAVLYTEQLNFAEMETTSTDGYLWIAETKTLTINACGIIVDVDDNVSSAIIVPYGTNILMCGDIVITGEMGEGSSGDVYGIYSTGSFVIEGNGNIEIDYGTHAIYSSGGDVTVDLTGNITLTTTNDAFMQITILN